MTKKQNEKEDDDDAERGEGGEEELMRNFVRFSVLRFWQCRKLVDLLT